MVADREELEKKLWENVGTVMDPDLRMSLKELGLIYKLQLNDDMTVDVDMTLTSMACPIGPMLQNQIAEACKSVEGIKDARVEVVWEPRWDPRTMASEEAQMRMGIF